MTWIGLIPVFVSLIAALCAVLIGAFHPSRHVFPWLVDESGAD